MKSGPKLLRRFVGIMVLSAALLLAVNFGAIVAIASEGMPNRSPWATAEEAAQSMEQTGQGYGMHAQMAAELREEQAWAIFLDNATGSCLWHSENLPKEIPLTYTASEIAKLTRGYVRDYPTFTGESEKGLMVLGYPKDSFWKDMWPSWDYDMIANMPKSILMVLALNVAVIFLIYVIANISLFASVKPIAKGIQALSEGERVHLKEKGVLSEIAVNLNRASDILQSQKGELRKKETARANWIAGVSHDIRTPLSMILGYAGQLAEGEGLTGEERKKAEVIVRQSQRMGNLISDLNLASKLEYNMQPLTPARENLIAIVRQAVVDFMNLDIDGKYPMEWVTDESFTACPVYVDKTLIRRAVNNLIQNSMYHNEQGCTIYVAITRDQHSCTVEIADDGVGATDAQLERLNHTPHYMVCDENTTEQRHGLGLLIVRQILLAHNGSTAISHSAYGGFSVKLTLPMA